MNILLIGNGSDLAHGLPIRYTFPLRSIEVIRQVLGAKGEKIDHIDWTELHSGI